MFTYNFITKYDKFSDFGYALIINVDYPEYLQKLHKELPLLPEKIIIKK